MRRRNLLGAFFAAPLFLPYVLPLAACAQQPISDVIIDGGPFVPTPEDVVERMLGLAGIRANDIVYDLGSGDGRLVIEAVRRYGARGVGVEREARLVEMARAAAVAAKVSDRVRFSQGDLFETDLRGATVVTMYLLPRLLELLLPKLRAELAPGTRVVSHDYPFDGWQPDRVVEFDSDGKASLMLSPRTQLFFYVVR